MGEKPLPFSISAILADSPKKAPFPIHLWLQQQAQHEEEECGRESEEEVESGSESEGSSSPPAYPLHLHQKLWGDRLGMPNRRIGHPYQTRAPAKHKKPRTSFKKEQVTELEKRFLEQKYLASTERAALAKSLRMSDAQVKTWFQNRRTKWRRQAAEEKEQERQVACRLLQSSPYLAAHYAPTPSYYARPDVAI